jgi:AcrR family transcriptional regulator
LSTDTPPRRGRGRPPQPDRPNQIADAAIRLLAENGSRSLSHRRVDKEAGLPMGSTTHHARSRGELLLMAARRLSALSQQELKPFSESIRKMGADLTPEDVARGVMTLWQPRFGTDQLYRLRAEITVLLSQDFEAEMRELFQPQIEVVEKFWQETMALLGSRNPQEAGLEFNLWSRGLFFMVALRGGIANEAEWARFEKWIARQLRSIARGEE